MKSSIRIDFVDDGKGLEPVIKVVIEDTDDPRDSLLRTFFQKLGGESSWLRVDFHSGSELQARKYLTIYPVSPSELHEMQKTILERTMKQLTS